MQVNKTWLLILSIALVLSSCIKSYEPQITYVDQNKIVISGVVTDLDGHQTVEISVTSPLAKMEYRPYSRCKVVIKDDKGNQFPMADSSDGSYHGYIDPKFIIVGSLFMVEVVTPDGNRIVSDFDKVTPCPAVDSIFYRVKNIPTNNPLVVHKGIQFYVNLKAQESDSRFFRYEAVETYEYRVDYPIEWYYDGKVHHVYPPDYSRMICWLTLLVRNIYLISTENLAQNQFPNFPLNFVDNKSSRLLYGYSLLVNQYSLSETAYKYWKQLSDNSTTEGDLYEKQPMAAQGNLHNLTQPDKDVLGYFGASSVRSKRIFVKNVENLELEYLSPCFFDAVPQWGLSDINPIRYPIYLMGDKTGWKPIILDKRCVDCLSLFGTNIKPDFWPN
jgi:hypothetical protein